MASGRHAPHLLRRLPPWAAALLLAAAGVGGVVLQTQLRPAAAARVPVAAATPTATPTLPALLRVAVPAAALRHADGTRDYTGDGLEATLAHELAVALGGAVSLVPVAPGEAAQAVHSGLADLAVAREEEHEGRGRDPGLAWLATTQHSGASVAMRSDTAVRTWADLAGRVVCATPATVPPASGPLAGAPLRRFVAPALVLAAVRTGQCDAALIDRAQLDALFQRPEWRKFSATLPPLAQPPLAVVVPARHAGLAAAVRGALRTLDTPAQWQRRSAAWAANVAFEVYFDQVGPDCH